MSQWYLSYEGKQIGPLDQVQAAAQARANPNGFAWRTGFAEWLPIPRVAELAQVEASAGPPPLSATGADDIDYKIIGSEMQFVEVELDPGESAIAEAGAP